MLPHFKNMEKKVGDGDSEFRGNDGEQIISNLEWRHPLCDAFIKKKFSDSFSEDIYFNINRMQNIKAK